MPEMKRTFQAGKMNRSNDERLVRPGEYREALNVNIGRSDSADIGAIENILGNVKVENPNAIDDGVCIGSYRDNGNERIYFFVTSNNDDYEENTGDHALFEYDQQTGAVNQLVSGDFLNFHQNYYITGINLVDGLLFWTDDRNEPRKINVTRARNDGAFYNSDDKTAVAKFAPISAPVITNISTTGNSSSFLEDKLVRFAYRFKFNDGEFSTISPLSPIAFKSITNDTNNPIDFSSGQIEGFINNAKRVFLEVNIPVNFGITAVEILYNESSSANIYILEEISANTDSENDDDIKVEYTYESQDPFRTLPGNQLTRVYDAIPRKAKSQEFAGGRLIYGDFLQNFNLPSISFEVGVQDIADDENNAFNRSSVKSRRTYQVGIVLADRYGRQSPVILSSTGGDTIFVDAKTGIDAMQQLTIKFNTDFPTWAYSYRVVVKQRQQEYYNWFFSGGNGTNFPVTGNNINKVPRDTTGDTVFVGNAAVAPSTIKVFPKLGTSGNSVTSQSLQVSSITYAQGTSPVATVNNTGLPSGAGVFETAPEESALDIFYETSSAGRTSNDLGTVAVDFYNCYVFNVSNSHLELNRIRAGFNETWFTVGLKAYVVQDNFVEQRRFNTLIHSSGLFNSRVGINYVNQFNEGEGGITISLDPADGSIQKLYAEDTQLLIFQEDKVSRSPIDKDFIYSAEGGAVPVTSSTQYLGTVAPYAGEYGISRDPGSFAIYGTRKYFTDKNRGVVLRLANDGLSEISEKGMSDFFRDALSGSNQVIGSFDEYHDQYNVTIIGNSSYGGFKDTNIATGKDGYFTVSFEEEVGGWSSFKSFQQEFGTTLNNRYYTIKGDIYEHNIGDTYNNFYGEQVESYMECIFNDAPSDIKEFKTVNYEGKVGWVCDTVETDQDNLRIDPEARQLDNVIIASLNVTESVQDGKLSGVSTQRVVVGQEFRWILRIDPTTSNFIFDDPTDVTVEFDGSPISGTVSNGSIYFLTQTYEAGNDDMVFDVSLTGAAAEDISGAILTISLVDNIDLDEVDVFIPTTGPFTSAFRAGQGSFAYVSNDENTDVEIGIEIDSEVNELRPVAELTFSASLTALLEGGYEELQSLGEVFFRQGIVLPQITTNGTVTVGITEGEDFVVPKPVVRLLSPTLVGDNFTVKTLVDDELVDLEAIEDLGAFNSNSRAPFEEIFAIPDFGGEGDDYFFKDGAVTVTGTSGVGSVSIELAEDDREELIGAFEISGLSDLLSQAANATDTSQNLDISFTINGSTTFTDDFDYQLRDQEGTPVEDSVTIDSEDDAKATIDNDDVRNAMYHVVNSIGEESDNTAEITIGTITPGSIDDPGSGGVLIPGDTYDINIGDAVAGNYTIILNIQPNENRYRGTQFTDVEIDITIT